MNVPLWSDWPATADDISRAALHVIRVRLADPIEESVDAWQELTAAEQARAQRYVVEPPRRRFLRCRRALRRCLGEITERAPASLEFGVERNGKPTLQLPGQENLQFNVSHSGDWGVIAVGWGRPLGVDIETIDPRLDILGLAERFFSPAEQEELNGLPAELQRPGFYRLWTSKEAYMKGLGLGMLLPLGSFTMAADPRQSPRLVGGDVREGPWFGAGFAVDPRTPGVLLWSGSEREICYWNGSAHW